MNCEYYQDRISEFIDGSLGAEDNAVVAAHLNVCVGCSEAKNDLGAILDLCLEQRGEYASVPNERALWLRLSNMIEMELPSGPAKAISADAGWWFRLMNSSWQLSFPQLAAAAAVIILAVSAITFVGLHYSNPGAGPSAAGLAFASNSASVKERFSHQEQVIAYWNERVELNKARWNPQMRETFDKNMSVIDTAVNDSMRQLSQNPHDEVSEEILNAALNDKVELLKEFAAL